MTLGSVASWVAGESVELKVRIHTYRPFLQSCGYSKGIYQGLLLLHKTQYLYKRTGNVNNYKHTDKIFWRFTVKRWNILCTRTLKVHLGTMIKLFIEIILCHLYLPWISYIMLLFKLPLEPSCITFRINQVLSSIQDIACSVVFFSARESILILLSILWSKSNNFHVLFPQFKVYNSFIKYLINDNKLLITVINHHHNNKKNTNIYAQLIFPGFYNECFLNYAFFLFSCIANTASLSISQVNKFNTCLQCWKPPFFHQSEDNYKEW